MKYIGHYFYEVSRVINKKKIIKKLVVVDTINNHPMLFVLPPVKSAIVFNK